jgi:pimeloyl-ACP methyl ester carboxylesterase
LHPLKEALRAPLQLTLAPVVDMFGSPAWENMHRRTNELFRQDPETIHDQFAPPNGALSVLLRRLETYLQERNKRPDTMRVVFIGHSMGTIVLTRFIRESRLPISSIVFMAGASTVRQFEETVVPYLAAHPETHFYNLTLNKVCEVRETHFGSFSPNGSLLVWLDDYLNRPETPEDHMIGRWTSLPAVLERLPAPIDTQVTFKGFGYRDTTVIGSFGDIGDIGDIGDKASKPCQHGEFSKPEAHFWRKKFWSTREPSSY